MPESSLVIRIDGADAERAAKSLDKALKGLTKSGDKVDKEFEEVNKEVGKSSKVFGGVRSSINSVKNAIAGIGIGLLTRQIFENTKRQQAAISAVESRIVSTGQAAGFTSEELEKMAAGFQKVTAVGDEAILEFQSVLLTFTKVADENFQRATEAILDMSTVMGTDLQSATLQVGKALNDPVRGIQAMNRAGVQFTDSQRKVIKTLVETGRIAEAQGIILNELQVQFGGAARAAKKTFAGALASVSNAFGDLLETGGGLDQASKSLLEFEKILASPEFVQAANVLTESLITGFSKVIEVTTDLINLGPQLGSNFFKNLNKSREVKLIEELERVNEEIRSLDEGVREGTVNINQYKDEIAGLTSEAFTLEEQLADARKEAEKPIEVEKQIEETFKPRKSKLESIVPPEENAKVQRLIDSLKQQNETIGLSNKEIQLYKLSLEDASEAQLKQAGIILDSIAAKERDIEVTKQQEEADEEALEVIEEENKAIEERSKLLSEYAATIDPVLGIEKQRAEEMEKLNSLLDAGVISQQAYNNRLEELEEAARDAALATGQLTEEQQGFEGAKAALKEYAEAASDTFTQVKDVVSNAFKEGEDALFNFAKTGKLEITDLVDSILDDLLRLSIKEGITGPLSQAFAGALGSPGGGTTTGSTGTADSAAGGGIGSFIAPLLGSLFGAQRGASMKIPNGGVDNQLLMLRAKAGESVDITPAAAASSSGGGEQTVTKNFFFTNNFSGVTDMGSFRENKDQINNDISKGLQESERNL